MLQMVGRIAMVFQIKLQLVIMSNALVAKANKYKFISLDFNFNNTSQSKTYFSISFPNHVSGNFVNCGQHGADTCYECPQGHGSNWCNGDCVWDHLNSECKKKGSQKCKIMHA